MNWWKTRQYWWQYWWWSISLLNLPSNGGNLKSFCTKIPAAILATTKIYKAKIWPPGRAKSPRTLNSTAQRRNITQVQVKMTASGPWGGHMVPYFILWQSVASSGSELYFVLHGLKPKEQVLRQSLQQRTSETEDTWDGGYKSPSTIVTLPWEADNKWYKEKSTFSNSFS